MSPTQDEPTLQELVSRLAELEQANARLHEELGALRAEHSTAHEQRVPLLPDVLGVFSSSVAGTPAVRATGTNGADGVDATSDSGVAISGTSVSNDGIRGTSSKAGPAGVVVGGSGVFGQNDVFGGVGVSGQSKGQAGRGVYGRCDDSLGTGVFGANGLQGQLGFDGTGAGVFGISTSGPGVSGTSTTGGNGVSGQSPQGFVSSAGVFGSSPALNSNGVIGEANNGTLAFGVWGKSTSGFAGFFSGKVQVTGNLSKGGGGFRIDHVLDPENKYLSHSFVESPDMLNVYNGNVTTDANGDATVMLPDYFEALNQDFRYQLTVIGQFAQSIVAEEIGNNQFAIKTDRPNVRVSWQVTGVRKDPFANMHRILAEEDKRTNERGMYLHPEAYGKPETQSIEHALGKVPEGS